MRRKSRVRRAAAGALIWILLAVLAALTLLPMLLTVGGSLMSEEELEQQYGGVLTSLSERDYAANRTVSFRLIPQALTGEQFQTLMVSGGAYMRQLRNALVLTVPIVVGQVAVAAMAAYSLARVKNRARRGVFFFYVILMLMPYQVTLVPNYLVARWFGWLGSRWAVIFPGVFAPMAVFWLARHMQRIPTVQAEAAGLDGAGEWHIFTRVYLPQCGGLVATVTLLVFLEYWNMVELPLVLLKEEQYPLSVTLSEISGKDAAVAFAAAVLYMIPPFLLFVNGRRHLADAAAVDGRVSKGQESVEKAAGAVQRWAVPAVSAAVLVALVCVPLLGHAVWQRRLPQVSEAQADYGVVSGSLYPHVLPEQAVVEQDGQSVLLRVRHIGDGESERLQIQYVAVTVLARDGENAAVTLAGGEWNSGDRFAVSWSEQPADGDTVRLLADAEDD